MVRIIDGDVPVDPSAGDDTEIRQDIRREAHVLLALSRGADLGIAKTVRDQLGLAAFLSRRGAALVEPLRRSIPLHDAATLVGVKRAQVTTDVVQK